MALFDEDWQSFDVSTPDSRSQNLAPTLEPLMTGPLNPANTLKPLLTVHETVQGEVSHGDWWWWPLSHPCGLGTSRS